MNSNTYSMERASPFLPSFTPLPYIPPFLLLPRHFVSVPLMSSLLAASAPLSSFCSFPLCHATCTQHARLPKASSSVILLAVVKEEIWGGKFNEVIHKPAVSYLCLFLAGRRKLVHPLGKLQDKVPAQLRGSCRLSHTCAHVWVGMQSSSPKGKLSLTLGYALHKAAKIQKQGAWQTEESSLRKQLMLKSTRSSDRHYLQRCQIGSAGCFSSGMG